MVCASNDNTPKRRGWPWAVAAAATVVAAVAVARALNRRAGGIDGVDDSELSEEANVRRVEAVRRKATEAAKVAAARAVAGAQHTATLAKQGASDTMSLIRERVDAVRSGRNVDDENPEVSVGVDDLGIPTGDDQKTPNVDPEQDEASIRPDSSSVVKREPGASPKPSSDE